MSDIDLINYGARKAGYGQENAAALARNAYTRFLAQQRGNRARFDLSREYEAATPKFVSQYSRRGLAGPGVQSGVYSKALTDFAQRQVERQNQIGQQEAEDIWQADWERGDIMNRYNRQLAELEAEKERAIANAAATLTAWKPFTGG